LSPVPLFLLPALLLRDLLLLVMLLEVPLLLLQPTLVLLERLALRLDSPLLFWALGLSCCRFSFPVA
jgi:hypothetical protein